MSDTENEYLKVLTAGPLRVIFRRHADRIGHTIEILESSRNEWLPILESIEGAATEPWPTSPPLQQLHVEDRGLTQVALMVGMAGTAHWSASVEANVEGQIRFDLACRTSLPAQKLSSRYRILNAAANHSLVIELHPFTRLERTENELDFFVADMTATLPVTFRWGYDLLAK